MKKTCILIALVIIACFAYGQTAGSSVQNPMDFDLPIAGFSANTADYGNNYTASMYTPPVTYLSYNEFVARFVLEDDSYLSGNVGGSNSWIVIIDQEPTAAIPAPTHVSVGGASGGSFNNQFLPAGTYYAVIGGFSPALSFNFSLSAVIAGSTYIQAKPLELPVQTYSDHTESYGNNYTDDMFDPANLFMTGNDFVGRFEISSQSLLSGSVSGNWTGLVIVDQEPSIPVPAPVYQSLGSSDGGSFSDLLLDPGIYYAIVSSNSSSSASSAFVLNLSAIELSSDPEFTISEDEHDFGALMPNESTSQTFTITNNGGGTLLINSIEIAGDMYFSLAELPTEYPVALEYGQSLSFDAIYSPLLEGNHSAIISISDNTISQRQTHTVQLLGSCSDVAITSLPHYENFDDVSAPDLPMGWSTIVETSAQGYVRTATNTPHSAPNNVAFYDHGDMDATLILASPRITTDLSSIRLSFWARGWVNITTLQVGTLSNPNDPDSFSLYTSIPMPGVNSNFIVDFDSYSGDDQYIAFKGLYNANYYFIYLDTIVISEIVNNDMAAIDIAGPSHALPLQELDYQVTVFNNGISTANGYTVKLMESSQGEIASLSVSSPLAPDSYATHTISWVPTSEGENYIYAKVVLAEDTNPANDETSRRKRLSVFPGESEFVLVGDPDTSLTSVLYPIDVFYRNSVSETIYLADDLGFESGEIQAFIYKNTFTQDLTKPIRVWLKNTTASSLDSGWLPFDGYSLMFEGEVHMPEGVDSVVIPLDAPFQYNGGNLALRVYREYDNAWSNQNKFYYTPSSTSPDRTRYHQADGTAPFDPISIASPGVSTDNIPNTTFVFTQDALDSPQIGINIVNDVVYLDWEEIDGANSVYINSYSSSLHTRKFFRVVASSANSYRDLGYVPNPASSK